MPLPTPETRLDVPTVEVSIGAGLALRPPEWAPWDAEDIYYAPDIETRAGLYPKIEIVAGAGSWLVGALSVGTTATPTEDRPGISGELRVGIPGKRVFDLGVVAFGGMQTPPIHLSDVWYWSVAAGAWGRVEFAPGWAARASWAPLVYGATAEAEVGTSNCGVPDSGARRGCPLVEVGPQWYTPYGPIDLSVYHDFDWGTVGLRYLSPGFPADLPMTGFAVLAPTIDVRWRSFFLRATAGGSADAEDRPLLYGELMVGGVLLGAHP